MSSVLSIYAWNLATVLVLMVFLWVYSLLIRDASIADVFWGLGFVVIAWVTWTRAGVLAPRSVIATLLTTVWGIRLAYHIGRRNLGKGEDPRYRKWREEYGARFWWVSLFMVVGLQGILLWVVSLVVQTAQMSMTPDRLAFGDFMGMALWVVGFTFEAVADRQLARFKADPANRGKVMDRGLWAYSRHPNYFGECLMWWGMFCFALTGLGNLWTIVSPLTITYLLLKVSGVTLLEKDIVERRPEYRSYMETTSAFIPWFPRKNPVFPDKG